MRRTVLFIHGGWLTPACWGPFVSFFEARGYECLAPAWPGKDRPVQAIRTDPSPLAGLGIGEIIDHYARIARALDEPPILIGHSFGGLVVQVLLDRGVGSAGIAIDTAPPKGIFVLEPTALLSVGRILLIPFGWRKVVRWTFPEFRYAFVHTLERRQARAIWEAQVVPDSGRPFFQSAFSMFDRSSPARVRFANPNRAPLLLIAGEADRAMTASIVRRTFRAYQASPARTELRTFPGRTHWLIAMDGWEEVAGACIDWIRSLSAGPDQPGPIDERGAGASTRELSRSTPAKGGVNAEDGIPVPLIHVERRTP